MSRIFKLINPAPLSVPIRSRDSFAYIYRAMKFVGWMPPERGISRYVYKTWTYFVFAFSTFYMPVGLFLSIALDYQNLTTREFYGVVQIAINSAGASIKSIMLLNSLKRLTQIKDLLDKLDERLQNASDTQIIRKAVASCNYVYLIHCLVFMTYSASMIMAGIVNQQPPWMIYNPLINWRNSPRDMWTQSLLEYISGGTAVMICQITDSYNIVFVMIFRAHLDILKKNVRNLRTNPLKTEAENYKDLEYCVELHELVMNCCDIMRPVLSSTIFVQFMLVGTVLGINLINLQYFTNISDVVSSIVSFAGNLSETFPFCYLCDMLVEDSDELTNLLGHSNWIDAEAKYKTTLRLFIIFVQAPIAFNAGGIFPVSMQCNVQLAKFAFSVMTLVQNMKLN